MPCRDYDFPDTSIANEITGLQTENRKMKGALDNLTRMLCGVLHTVEDGHVTLTAENILDSVDGLEEWWIRHKKLDAIREEKERKEAARKAEKARREEERRKLRENALSKLSLEEKKALGIA
jgi:hypothetical protein